MRRSSLPALALLLLGWFAVGPVPAVPQEARGTHAVSHADVWLMQRVGRPAVSPDGRWAVFSVSEPSYEKDEAVSDLWIVATDGTSPARRLTSTRGSEGDPAWDPDGTKLAFTAKREGDDVAQIYLLDMTGPGEAQRLTELSTGAAGPVWSPDGARLAFGSEVYPGAADDEANRKIAKERKERKVNVSAYDGFPIRQWDHWLADRQTHLFVVPADGSAAPRDLLAGTALVAETGYDAAGDNLQVVWTPDGKGLVFVATTERNQAARAFVSNHLFRVPLEGGEPARLTSGQWSFSRPRFARDGGSLLCVVEPVTKYVYNHDRLARLAWPEPGEPVLLTASWDRSVEDLAESPDGGTILLLADDHGRTRIFAVPAGGGSVTALAPSSGGVYAGLSMSASAPPVLMARWEDATHPAEIVRLDLRTGIHTALTSLNVERAAAIDWRPFEEMWFESSKGRRIHSWLALPPAFDATKQYPLVLLIHGGPYGSSEDANHLRWSPHLLAAPGYVVLMTNYTGSTGYGEQFSRNIQGDPLATPGQELVEAAEEAARRFPFVDGTRMAAAGASYGGHLVNWLQATTDRFACLIGHAGLVNLESQWGTSDGIYHREVANGGPPWEQGEVWRTQNPIRRAAQFRTPILVTVGEKDYRVPLNQSLENWSALQRMGVPSRLIVFHDANHWIMKGPEARYYWEEVHAWLARWLGQ